MKYSVDNSERPDIVNMHNRVGIYEIDAIVRANNGFLFKNHKTVTEKLGVQVYFARLYHS
jgi:IS30 family transposase